MRVNVDIEQTIIQNSISKKACISKLPSYSLNKHPLLPIASAHKDAIELEPVGKDAVFLLVPFQFKHERIHNPPNFTGLLPF